MKNLLFIFVILFGFIGAAQARPFENPISSAIRKADISNSALISVSFKEIPTGKTVYELNANTPMTPASVQKIVTVLPALNTLGKDYEFKTQLYKNKDNNLYIKLGADPYFTTADLKNMIRKLPDCKIYSTKAFYIDDFILDNNEWGEGWQWDDDLNPLIPKFGSYNMDKNLLTINVLPTKPGAPADILTEVFYPTAFINNVVTGNKNEVKLERKNYISPDVINADGVVLSDMAIQIPVNYPRRYFIFRLEELLRRYKISYYGDFNKLKLPPNTYLIAEVKHPMSSAIEDIFKRSNNMTAETVFKIAGGQYTKATGSIDAAVEMLNDYYKKLGINTDNIKIVDGSGVSKNNLLTADFVTEVLLKTSQNKDLNFKALMASPGEGTLSDRMLYFKDALKAKTGTLTNTSSIAGYLSAKSGKNYAFCIMINDPKSKSADKKAFEEYLLRKAHEEL
ncbi:MAG: D-alanyl-D-alanine carboxypeptidase/D-alanyl-D-alanine-endopeptidase [Candidatus Gastranaerophilales bacterium]|nr:D-alanyl-D-alanine carboxypeptidase/D-alanyl-D-alanine-endopeptidase [Candidatus Gastranaerophilales bacterium]